MTLDSPELPADTGPPPCITADPLWRMEAYRLAMDAADRAWADATQLDAHRVTRPLAAQLYRAVGSISANIAEGFSRSSPRDRRRLLEYALGSAREARTWYWGARHVLTRGLVDERLGRLTSIVRLITTAIIISRRTSEAR